MASSNHEPRAMQPDDEHKQSKGQQHQEGGHGKSGGGQQGGQGSQRTDRRDEKSDDRANVDQRGRKGSQSK